MVMVDFRSVCLRVYSEASSSVISADEDGNILSFTDLAFKPGVSWIHPGFQACGGYTLPKLGSGRWTNLAEHLTANL